jgi:hypothetical protein
MPSSAARAGKVLSGGRGVPWLGFAAQGETALQAGEVALGNCHGMGEEFEEGVSGWADRVGDFGFASASFIKSLTESLRSTLRA